MDNGNTEIIRGHADTIILRVLEQRDSYAYEILDLIGNASDGRYSIKQPTLYSCLKRLEKQGFISSYFGDENNTGGGRRRYYTLTEKGTATLNKDQREWEYSRTILDKLLSDKQVDLETVDAPFDANNLRPYTKRVRVYDTKDCANEAVAEAKSIDDEDNAQIFDNADSNSEDDAAATIPAQNGFNATLQPTIDSPTAEKPIDLETQERNAVLAYQKMREEAILAEKARIEEERLAKEREAAQIAEQAKLEEEKRQAQIKMRQDEAAQKLMIGVYRPFEERETLNSGIKLAPQPNRRYEQTYTQRPQTPPTPEQVYASDILFNRTFPQKERMTDVVESDRKGTSSDYVHQSFTQEQPVIQRRKASGDEYRRTLSEVYSSLSPFQDSENAQQSGRICGKSAVAEVEARQAVAGDDFYEEGGNFTTKTKMFYDTCKTIEDEGFKVKQYSAPNSTNYYYMKYIYSNRILRDTSAITYLFLAILVLILYLAKSFFGYSNTALLVITLVGLLIPLIPTVKWIMNPTRRSKANFNFASAFKNACITFVLVSTIATIINLVTPSVNVASGKFYAPYLLTLIIPASVAAYGLLYKSGNYHVK